MAAEIARTVRYQCCAITICDLIYGCLQLSRAQSASIEPPLESNSTIADEPITPIPEPPPIDPLKIKLGGRLFGDPRLSHANSRSCSWCHDLHEWRELEEPGRRSRRLEPAVQYPNMTPRSISASARNSDAKGYQDCKRHRSSKERWASPRSSPTSLVQSIASQSFGVLVSDGRAVRLHSCKAKPILRGINRRRYRHTAIGIRQCAVSAKFIEDHCPSHDEF